MNTLGLLLTSTSEFRMSHVTHMNASCHTCECFMSHIRMPHVTHMNVLGLLLTSTSEFSMGHVTDMNASCHWYECVMSQIWIRHVIHTIALCHTYECVRVSTDVNVGVSDESCHTYECVIWMRQGFYWRQRRSFRGHVLTIPPTSWHIARIFCWCKTVKIGDESCLTYEWVMSHLWMSHTTSMPAAHTWLLPFIFVACLCIHPYHSPDMAQHSHVWVMPHVDESRHSAMARDFVFGTQMNHVPYECFISRINESFLMWISHGTHQSCLTYEWVMSHIWMSHVPHMNESCLTYEWVMSHIWMSHVSHMNESCLTYEWKATCVQYQKTTTWSMTHVTHMNESCLTYKRVMSHTWMRHPRMNQFCLTCQWVMSHIWISHVSHINVSCCTLECVIYVWISFISPVNESCLTYEWVMSHICISHVSHMNEQQSACSIRGRRLLSLHDGLAYLPGRNSQKSVLQSFPIANLAASRLLRISTCKEDGLALLCIILIFNVLLNQY